MAGKVIFLPASRSDLAYRVGGTLVGVLLGVITAIWEALLTPLTFPGSTTVRMPVALVAAVVGNAAIVWFTYRVTRHVGLALLPGLAWLIVMGVAGTTTSDGDLILTGNNWVGLATIATGALAWAGTGYWLIIKRANARAAESGETGVSLIGGRSMARQTPPSVPPKRGSVVAPRPGAKPVKKGRQ